MQGPLQKQHLQILLSRRLVQLTSGPLRCHAKLYQLATQVIPGTESFRSRTKLLQSPIVFTFLLSNHRKQLTTQKDIA